MTPEFWETVFFFIVIPLLQQVIKLISDNYGYTFDKWLNQLIALVLGGLFAWATGGFLGIELPVWSGDLFQFINQAGRV